MPRDPVPPTSCPPRRLSLREKRWLRALGIAKILMEDQGYHTVFLEQIEAHIWIHGDGGSEAPLPDLKTPSDHPTGTS